MKSTLKIRKWWLLLFAPLFINGVCNKDNDDVTADQYVKWQIPGYNGSLTVPPDSLDFDRYSGTTTSIFGLNNSGSTIFSVSFDGAQVAGTYPSNYFSVFTDGRYYVQSGTPLQINVTNYGSAGQYVTGTYSGTVKDSTASSIISVNGEFRVKNR